MNEPMKDEQVAAAELNEADTLASVAATTPVGQQEELKLSEMLILASMWMIFGFMLWFYLSAFHGAPARMMADFFLSEILGDSFRQIIIEPNQNFLFQVETNIQYVFRDGTQEALGFIVNPLIFSYGLPLLFGLVMGSDVSWLRKLVIMLIGYSTITLVQVWGVVFQSLKMLAFNFGEQSHVFVTQAGVSDSTVALGYQLGTLIFPALMPIFVWVLTNRPLVEQFVGWSADALRKDVK
ncbi:MAG: exosortase H-associated membrane protein [Xanthomonadales bacterium]|nr:exosortase H-associated membrane protein [Xanthomonadales bacterium]